MEPPSCTPPGVASPMARIHSLSWTPPLFEKRTRFSTQCFRREVKARLHEHGFTLLRLSEPEDFADARFQRLAGPPQPELLQGRFAALFLEHLAAKFVPNANPLLHVRALTRAGSPQTFIHQLVKPRGPLEHGFGRRLATSPRFELIECVCNRPIAPSAKPELRDPRLRNDSLPMFVAEPAPSLGRTEQNRDMSSGLVRA